MKADHLKLHEVSSREAAWRFFDLDVAVKLQHPDDRVTTTRDIGNELHLPPGSLKMVSRLVYV